MNNFPIQSHYEVLKNDKPDLEPISLNNRLKKAADGSEAPTYDDIYKTLVDYIFKQAQNELQNKIDDEKEPSTW